MNGLSALVLRLRSALLLIAARDRVAAGDFDAARKLTERIFARHQARGLDVPLNADIMRALIAWNMHDHGETISCVRRAADKIGQRLAKARPERSDELHYLRAFCWTLLHHSEASGASVSWQNFADLVPASHVNLARVSRTVREMFPVGDEVFVLGKA